MTSHDLESVALTLVAEGKGILAAEGLIALVVLALFLPETKEDLLPVAVSRP